MLLDAEAQIRSHNPASEGLLYGPELKPQSHAIRLVRQARQAPGHQRQDHGPVLPLLVIAAEQPGDPRGGFV